MRNKEQMLQNIDTKYSVFMGHKASGGDFANTVMNIFKLPRSDDSLWEIQPTFAYTVM